MRRINESVCRQSRRGMFVTLFYIVLKKNSGEASYINAGHVRPVIWNSSTGKYDILSRYGGPPLGIDPDQHYVSARMSLDAGSCVLLSTDGLMEAKNDSGELLGLDGMEKWLMAGSSNAESVMSRLSFSLSRFAGERRQADDITLVVAEFKGA